MSGNNNGNIFLGDRIVEYAHDLLATHTVREYEYVIGKWEDYINRVIDAEKMALDEHQKVLNAVLNQIQQQQQAGAMFAMLALTLVTGPALSWIGGAIQYKLYPLLASQNRWKTAMVYMQNRLGKGNSYRMSISESEHNRVAAKIFGDAASNVAQQVGVERFLGRMVANISPRANTKTHQELSALLQIPANAPSRDLHQSLRTRMEASLRDEKEKTVKTISDMALELRRSSTFIKGAYEFFVKLNAQVRGGNVGVQQMAADRFVERMVDEQREKWAKEWLYYGNLPPQTSIVEMSRKIEREIWAMWIIDQEFTLYSQQKGSFAGEVDGTWEELYVAGRDGLAFHSLIVARLTDLGVVIPQTSRQFADLNERNWGNPNKEKPTVLVKDSVDDSQELDEIQAWAKNRQPELLSGHFDSQPRNIGSIVNVHKLT